MQKWSIVYRNLKPFILADIGAGNSGAGGTTLASVPLHGLADTSKHSGQLSTAQAPWAVTTSVFAAHTGNTNAHHNQVHTITGTDHTVTGSQWQIVGLTATNTLGLLTASATPGVNQVVKTDGSSKVTLATAEITGALYVDDIVDFGTDYITEGATYLSVFGTKPVYFNQAAQSSGWSISTAGAASFNGGVSVIGSDLTVGANVLFVDYSLANVGINCAPDPQFALDVAGPARAQYFIGPHAIQLKDAVLISHFDGPDDNDLGEPNGHMGQIPTVSGTVNYRYGKFGKAVEISSVHSNMCTSNPSFETDAVGTAVPTGWSTYQVGTAAGGRAVTDVKRWDSTKSLRIWKTGGAESDNWGVKATNVATAASTNYAITVRVYLEDIVSSTPTGSIATLVALCGANTNSASTYITDEWVELALKITSDAGASAMQIWVSIDNCATGTLYVDALQMIQSNAQRPYVAGTSTASSFAYDNLALNWGAFSVSAWVYLTDIASSSNVTLRPFSLNVHGDTTARIEPYFHNSTNKLYAQFVPSGGSGQPTTAGATAVTAQAWHHVALTVAGRLVSVYLDGVLQGTVTATGMQTGLAQLYVGMYNGGNQLNGMVDDLAVCNKTWTATEVRAIYESNAPVFAESSIWSFRATPKGLVWADEEGLWMRTAAGNPAFGIYGNDTSTKSWGGFTLDAGDLVIGNNVSSSSAILWDATAGTFGFYGNGSGTAQAQIGTNGVLFTGTAGAQRVQMSSAELAGYNSSNQRQWYGSTSDGKLYGGEGAVGGAAAVWMDRSGLSITAPITSDLSTANTISFPTLGNLGVLSGFIGCGWNGTSGNPNGEVTVNARTGAGTSKIFLQAAEVSASSKFIAGKGEFSQSSTTGAAPTMALTQSDLSEEFIRFNTTVGAGNAVDTAALGTYYGKVRVSVNGTFKWLALYN